MTRAPSLIIVFATTAHVLLATIAQAGTNEMALSPTPENEKAVAKCMQQLRGMADKEVENDGRPTAESSSGDIECSRSYYHTNATEDGTPAKTLQMCSIIDPKNRSYVNIQQGSTDAHADFRAGLSFYVYTTLRKGVLGTDVSVFPVDGQLGRNLAPGELSPTELNELHPWQETIWHNGLSLLKTTAA